MGKLTQKPKAVYLLLRSEIIEKAQRTALTTSSTGFLIIFGDRLAAAIKKGCVNIDDVPLDSLSYVGGGLMGAAALLCLVEVIRDLRDSYKNSSDEKEPVESLQRR
jgi:hypothetical protein